MHIGRPSTIFLSFATILSLALAGAPARADVVTDWNVIATTAIPAGGLNFPAITGSRILAMTHAAIHDALNAIDRRYKPYALDRLTEPGASPEAAVAAAAHDVLVAQIPAQQATLDAAYASSLASIPDGAAKSRGVAIGQAAAVAILALRSADGSNAPMPYTPGTGPRAWQPTPPAFLPAALSGWGQVTPFALSSGAQFRPARPAFFDLTSAEYTADYNEVKSIGDAGSATRAAEALARFFGTDAVGFTTTSGAPFPGITRSFTGFSQAARENADSRVYAGIHFRTACQDGLTQGAQVGSYVFEQALRSAFDTCLRDERSGDILRFDSASGDYQFLRCGADGFTLIGRGDVRRAGCVLSLSDAGVRAEINHCPNAPLIRGHATVRATPLGPALVINDRDANNNNCVCR